MSELVNQKYIQKINDFLTQTVDLIDRVPDLNAAALADIAANIKALRDESLNCKEDDLPGIIQQMNLLNQLADRYEQHQSLPNAESPFFGHFKIKQNGKLKDFLIGHTPFSHKELKFKIIDWKKSPMARIFYQYGEGDDFDFDLDDRIIEGHILEKSILTVREKQLVRIDREGNTNVLREGEWISLNESAQKLAGGEGSANQSLGSGRTGFDGPEVISLLDKTQYDLVNQSAKKPLLITGGAGSGKTTVALYRIAKLCREDGIRQEEVMVIVPNNGLVKLSKKLLVESQLEKVRVSTLDDLIKKIVFQNMRSVPKKIEDNPLDSIATIKRNPKLLELVDEYLAAKELSIEKKLKGTDLEFFTKNRTRPLYVRVKNLYENTRDPLLKVEVKKILNGFKNVREELLNIFSDSKLMEKLPEMTNRMVTTHMLNDLKFYTAKQIQGLDKDSDYANHGQDLSGFVDKYDLPLFNYLIVKQFGHLKYFGREFKSYRHIFLDEAQELSKSELVMLGQIKHQDGNFTIAGDSVQQIDSTFEFTSWHDVCHTLELDVDDMQVEELNVSYRSPKEIVSFAHKVLGPLAPKELPESKRDGGPIIETSVQHLEHASMLISSALVELMNREPKASIAIICSKESIARELYSEIEEVGSIRLVLDENFSLRPGVDVTTVEQIRGLEFDYVIIPDCDKDLYPANNTARKRLHLAATRAIHQLWILFKDKTLIA
ncbi:UvrD/REP helicase N-terminal domain protein [Bacteriovorax sp. BAL6_X]|uniref:UvrD-helicase domain-containing protein n=1 Tax=Bacteriovorax sp. BAL6_X TaxID=1201290 RepID=UPI00038641D9|nr:UvrD-helicase domain-containing protein [Bacteriovorax sp. BAL6_X]EPZ51858.1 UvrD/REP helicase N-terminal domain protein [Bacteriovorax sp. BAL6_X]